MQVLKVLRLINRDNVVAERKQYCEVCGDRAHGDPHHIVTVGSGGPDIPENLIQLCWQCHYGKAHGGKLTKRQLFAIVAKRMKRTIEDIEETVNRVRRTGEYGQTG